MPAGIRRKYKAEAKGRLRRARQGADKEGELSVWPSCRRREHRWQVDAPDTLPAEPLQKQQGNCRQALNLSTQVLEVLHSANRFGRTIRIYQVRVSECNRDVTPTTTKAILSKLPEMAKRSEAEKQRSVIK